MQKRKAKRKKTALNVDLEISRQINEQEKMQEVALLDLIAKIIVGATLRDLDSDQERSDDL